MENNNANSQVQTTTILSEEARQVLLELQTKVHEQISKTEIRDYIKLRDGDHKVLRFEPERTKSEMISYNDNQKPVLQYIFYASELINEQQNAWTRARQWTISPKWANLVISLLVKGFLILEVIRTGSDMNNTNYSVTPYLKQT
jgi:hypothetical protein